MTNRRDMMLGAASASLAALPAQASAPDLRPLVEAVMQGVVPSLRGDSSVVDTDSLRALCEAAGVEWRTHWAILD